MATDTKNSEQVLAAMRKLVTDLGSTTTVLFNVAVHFYKEKEGSKALEVNYKDRMYMLALINQARNGKYSSNDANDVGFLNLAGNDRRKIWQSFGDMPKEQAMNEFLTRLINMTPLFDPFLRAHVELTKKRQKEEFDQVLEDERSAAEQEQVIKAELNRQTESQFKQYAEFLYPRNPEAQKRLIEGLQEQHFNQYMDQAYNFRQQAANEILNQPRDGVEPSELKEFHQTANNKSVKEVTLPEIPGMKVDQPVKAHVYSSQTAWNGGAIPKTQINVRDISPPDLPKPKSSKNQNISELTAIQPAGNVQVKAENEKPKETKTTTSSKTNGVSEVVPTVENITLSNKYPPVKDNTKITSEEPKSVTKTKVELKNSTGAAESKLPTTNDSSSKSNSETHEPTSKSNNITSEQASNHSITNGHSSQNLDYNSNEHQGLEKVNKNISTTGAESKTGVNQKKKQVINKEMSSINEKIIPNSSSLVKTSTDEANGKVEPGNIWMRKDREAFLKAARADPDSCVKVASGETVTIRIPRHDSGKGMFCEFCTETYDIGIGLFYEKFQHSLPSTKENTDVKDSNTNDKPDDGSDVSALKVARGRGWKARRMINTIIPVERRSSDADVICFSHTYPSSDGVYHIKFDNSFSYWHGKTVYYRVYYTR